MNLQILCERVNVFSSARRGPAVYKGPQVPQLLTEGFQVRVLAEERVARTTVFVVRVLALHYNTVDMIVTEKT
jgi:hypothetical protein